MLLARAHGVSFLTVDELSLHLPSMARSSPFRPSSLLLCRVVDDIRVGRIVDVLPDWAPRAGIIHAVFPSRRGLLPSVRALPDFLAAGYARLDRDSR